MKRALLALCLLLSGTAIACKVPVFRYALERWEPDAYRAVFFHDTSTGEERSPNLGQANLRMEHVYLDALTEAQKWQFDDLPADGTVRLYYPDKANIEEPFYEANGLTLETVIHSPCREQIKEALLQGASAVWVLIESGDAEKDEAAFDRLTEGLAAVEGTIDLPEGVMHADEVSAQEGPVEMDDVLRTDIPLTIAFPSIRFNPEDPNEVVFAKMLTGFMRRVPQGEPVAVPVFGRGRALEGIPASQMDADTLGAACSYLCGECSCQVKDQNPGMDLLLDVGWSEALKGSFVMIERELPPLSGFTSPPTEGPETATLAPQPSTSGLPRALAMTSMGLLGCVLVGTYLITRKRFG